MSGTELMTADNKDRQSINYWSQRISSDWFKAVESIIQTGNDLLEAKDNLGGKFHQMIKKHLPFGERTAQRLMKIAVNPVLSDATHVSRLPPSWGTLYALTKLPTELLEARLADGSITPELERKDVPNLTTTGYRIVEAPVSPIAKLKNENAELVRKVAHLEEELAGKDGPEPEPEPLPEMTQWETDEDEGGEGIICDVATLSPQQAEPPPIPFSKRLEQQFKDTRNLLKHDNWPELPPSTQKRRDAAINKLRWIESDLWKMADRAEKKAAKKAKA